MVGSHLECPYPLSKFSPARYVSNFIFSSLVSFTFQNQYDVVEGTYILALDGRVQTLPIIVNYVPISL